MSALDVQVREVLSMEEDFSNTINDLTFIGLPNENCEFTVGPTGIVRFNFDPSVSTAFANNIVSAGASCSSYLQCENQFCTDGVCCNSSCSGQVCVK